MSLGVGGSEVREKLAKKAIGLKRLARAKTLGSISAEERLEFPVSLVSANGCQRHANHNASVSVPLGPIVQTDRNVRVIISITVASFAQNSPSQNRYHQAL